MEKKTFDNNDLLNREEIITDDNINNNNNNIQVGNLFLALQVENYLNVIK